MRFALLAGEHVRDFVVIGGLNPDFLAPDSPVPHQGTADVDLLFELGFVYDRDDLNFAWLDEALRLGGFVESRRSAGWQWDGILGEAKVRLDLLCDVADSQGQTVHLPGATEAAVQNLNGPAAALHEPVSRSLAVPDRVRDEFPESPQEVGLRFASLGGYIAAKSAALLARRKEKDAYDLMFVIMYAPGGPRAAAAAARQARVPDGRPPVSETIRSAVSQFSDSSSDMTGTAVRVLIAAGDDSDEEQLRSDVSVASRQFLQTFDADPPV